MRPRATLIQSVPAILLIAALAGSGTAGAAPRALSIGPNVNVSKMTGNQSETTVAINPTNPSNVVIVSNIESGSGLFKAFSTDGGATWTAEVIADGDALGFACCDPSAAFDAFGNLFLIYLNSSVNHVLAAISTDGGAMFAPLATISTSAAPPVSGGGIPSKASSPDQPTVTTGPGSVWVTWKEFAIAGTPIRARGAMVTGLGVVGAFSPAESAPGSGGGSFGDIAVGPAGQVLVTYQDPTSGQGPATIRANLDPDGFGPAGFGSAVAVTTTNVGGFDFIPAQSGRSVDAEAGLAYDRSGGPRNGRVYLVYTDETVNENNDTEIFVRFSDDDGATWTSPVRVNNDSTTNSQFNPKIALDQTTGRIAVSWYDCRADLGAGGGGDTNGIPNDDARMFAAVSANGSTFGPNKRLSNTSNAADAANGIDFGDYIGLAFQGGVFQPAWADNSNSTHDNPDGRLHEFDIYTVRVTVT